MKETRRRVKSRDQTMRNPRQEAIASSAAGKLGRGGRAWYQIAVGHAKTPDHVVQDASSTKQTVRHRPPFKSFESLYASSPYQRISSLSHHCLYYYQASSQSSRPCLHYLHKQPRRLLFPRVTTPPYKQELLTYHQAETRQHKAKMFVYKRGMSLMYTSATLSRAQQMSLPPQQQKH